MSLKKRALVLLVAVAASGACSVDPSSTAKAQAPAARQSVPPADAQTLKIVAAANAFIATLSEAQQKAVIYAFTDSAQRANWTNLPVGIRGRGGLAWGDLNPQQQTALWSLLGTVLSPEGTKMVREQMDADDELTRGASGGGFNGGRGGPRFGSAFYYVSFLGQPSATAPWMMQFGGHHLAINATIAGANLTLAPSLTGGQPVTYVKDGKTIYIVENEVKQSMAMLNSLTPAQRAKVVMSDRAINLVLGAGQDGRTLQPEGLAAAEMSEAQKTRLLALIEARLDIVNDDDLAAAMAEVRRNIDQTYFAWYGPTTLGGASYFRVTGPTLLIEFSPQDNPGGVSDHIHNMYRNPTNDYGAAWAALK